MKSTLLLASLFCANLTLAADIPALPSPTTIRWADRCTDFNTNGWAFKGPRNFLQWLDVFSDPAIWLEFGRRGLEPQSYVRTLSSMMDAGAVKNWLEWTDPAIYEKWAKASTEPDFYTAVDATLFDSSRMMRWAMLPTDPRAWKLMALALSPATFEKWLAAPWEPQTQALIAKALDPQTAMKWGAALANPENYPALEPALLPLSANPYLKESGTSWKRAI